MEWGPFMKFYIFCPMTITHCGLVLYDAVKLLIRVRLCAPHGLQHARLPCPSLFPRVCSNSCPLTPSDHLIFCRPLLLLPSIFPNIPTRSFPMSWLFTLGAQNIGASASISVLPMNIQSPFPLGLTGLISLVSKGLSCVFSSTTVQKHQFFSAQPSLWSNSDIHS